MRVARSLDPARGARRGGARTREPGSGDVVCRVLACGVCGSDVIEAWVARKVPDRARPRAGGRGHRRRREVDGVAVGDRVVVHHHVPCGECRRCRRGHETLCERFKRHGPGPRRLRRARPRAGRPRRRAARPRRPRRRARDVRRAAGLRAARLRALRPARRRQPARRGLRDGGLLADRRRPRAGRRGGVGARAAPRAPGARAGPRRRAPRQRARRRGHGLHAEARRDRRRLRRRRSRRSAVPVRAARPRPRARPRRPRAVRRRGRRVRVVLGRPGRHARRAGASSPAGRSIRCPSSPTAWASTRPAARSSWPAAARRSRSWWRRERRARRAARRDGHRRRRGAGARPTRATPCCRPRCPAGACAATGARRSWPSWPRGGTARARSTSGARANGRPARR